MAPLEFLIHQPCLRARRIMSLDEVRLSTTHGLELLEFENRFYKWDNKSAYSARESDNYYYECVESGCKGRLTYQCFRTQGIPAAMHVTKDHTCIPSSAGEILVKKARRAIHLKVEDGSKAADAWTEIARELSRHPDVSPIEAAQLPQLIDMRRNLNGVTNKRLGNPPKQLDEINDIPAELTVTNRGDTFLLVFSDYKEADGSPGAGPIIVYSTKRDLQELFRADKVLHILLAPHYCFTNYLDPM